MSAARSLAIPLALATLAIAAALSIDAGRNDAVAADTVAAVTADGHTDAAAAVVLDAAAAPNVPTPVERGRYLALAGNCESCHTARGGAPYAGGTALQTPFGSVYASNLTPDEKTGIGHWSADEFWQAMHDGRSRDGRLLYPAFPYPDFTLITREDSDAIFAYLKSLKPVEMANRAHGLRFPYSTQAALRGWRTLFFKPGIFTPDDTKSAEWNRGAYLVRGLGHCAACHSTRNMFGAISEEDLLSGGLIPMQNWYAPSLTSPEEAGVAEWPAQEVVNLLKTGTAHGASVMGPMAEVVYRSTQYLSDADLNAMAVFLKALPSQPVRPEKEAASGNEAALERGEKVYGEQCANCHGDSGEGTPGAFPALAGNRAVTLADPTNVIRAVLDGGYLPSTAGNPRPYGMPPFAHALGDSDVAAVVSWVRGSWGNSASAVTDVQVLQYR